MKTLLRILASLFHRRRRWEDASAMQVIFAASRINGGIYLGERLTAQRWEWPKETWLQKRLSMRPINERCRNTKA